jgi:hypothetical protein
MYSELPTMLPTAVNIVFSVNCWPIAFAATKSMILGDLLLHPTALCW